MLLTDMTHQIKMKEKKKTLPAGKNKNVIIDLMKDKHAGKIITKIAAVRA